MCWIFCKWIISFLFSRLLFFLPEHVPFQFHHLISPIHLRALSDSLVLRQPWKWGHVQSREQNITFECYVGTCFRKEEAFSRYLPVWLICDISPISSSIHKVLSLILLNENHSFPQYPSLFIYPMKSYYFS